MTTKFKIGDTCYIKEHLHNDLVLFNYHVYRRRFPRYTELEVVASTEGCQYAKICDRIKEYGSCLHLKSDNSSYITEACNLLLIKGTPDRLKYKLEAGMHYGMCDTCKHLKVSKNGYLLWCNKENKPKAYNNLCHLYKLKRKYILKENSND